MIRFLFSIALLLSLSCKEKQQSPLKYNPAKYSVRLVDTKQKLEIPVDKFTIPVTNCIQLMGDSLAFLRDSSILILSIKNKISLGSINFTSKGKHAIENVFSFLFVNPDTIFLITKDPRFIYLIDSAGDVKDKYTVTNEDDEYYPLSSGSAGGAVMIFKENKLYFNIASILQHPDEVREQLKKIGSSTLCLNLSTRETSFVPFASHDKHNWNAGNEPYPSTIFNGEKFIYSFLSNHKLYSFNGENTEITDASSDYFKAFIEEINGDDIANFKKYLTKIVRGDEYVFITYDPYRQVYYRFMYIGSTPDDNINLKKLTYMRPQFTIVILNQNLKKIGETKMPVNRHVAFNHFVNADGLYLSNNHFLNKESNEETLSFSLYKLDSLAH